MNSLTVFKALAKNWLRTKSGVFFSILFPLMLLLIFGSVFGGNPGGGYTLYVQNNDLEGGKPTSLSEVLVSALDNIEALDIKELPAGVEIEKYRKENPSLSIDRALVIPKGFQSSAMDGNVTVSLLTSGEGPATSMVQGVIDSVINMFNYQMSGVEPIINIDMGSLEKEEELSAVDYYLPGYIAAFIMINGIMAVTTYISEFRRNGIIKRLAATPLKKSSWILGNLTLQAVLGFLLTLVMVVVAMMVFGVQAIPGPYALILIFLGSVTFCSIGIVLGGVIKDTEAANTAGSAIAFPMMFLSGAFWPIEMVPSFMQTIAKFLPVYYFHEGLREIMIKDSPSQALVPFLIFTVLAVVFTFVAVKVTKWEEFE
ncbi:hypothetical protein AKJ37_00170 [candidate division MSBL1 archaeon SCGC-AAA259I09]|uniref:ABC transmembrane type-2 domain-containing protein n=4 Tax=candidate division MSBL1 TaxID=215777 RepID=A0A133UW15_9EURY|nr:hypothetical protein AKJ61_00410 [candidate division MSBL1 archaeon SCGC-AAA259B11]KXA98411.1 hypothetical protein AKJ37_00170 [candidate division MSBL1 archaeon SCGC-AAA259I09]